MAFSGTFAITVPCSVTAVDQPDGHGGTVSQVALTGVGPASGADAARFASSGGQLIFGTAMTTGTFTDMTQDSKVQSVLSLGTQTNGQQDNAWLEGWDASNPNSETGTFTWHVTSAGSVSSTSGSTHSYSGVHGSATGTMNNALGAGTTESVSVTF